MPTNAIYDITQSTDGIMWFLTAKGVVNYNALDWYIFSDSLQLPSTAYSVIQSHHDGTIWVAGQNQNSFVVKYYHDNRWTTVNIPGLPKIPSKFSFDVKIEKDSYTLLVCNLTTAYIFNTGTKQLKVLQLPENRDLQINSASFNKKEAYFSTNLGLFIADSSLAIKAHPVNKLISNNQEILQIHWKGNDLFLLGIGWLGKYKEDKFSYFSRDTGISSSSPFNKHNLTTDQFNRFFYSSNSSAKHLDKESETGETLYINGRVYNALSNRIFVDVENNVWVGDHRGLFKFNVLRFKNYNENTKLAKDEVTAITQIGDEIILANATSINYLKEGTVTHNLPIPSPAGTRVLDIATDKFGHLYIAANTGGLIKYDGEKFHTPDWKTISNERGVTSVEIFDDNIYFSTDIALYTYRQNKIEKEIGLLGIRNIQALEHDSIIALSSYAGLTFYKPKSGDTTQYISSNRKYNNVYSTIKWRGNYYVGTAGGLAKIVGDKIMPILLDAKLNRVAIFCLMISKKDHLWMGTNEGVFIWDGKVLINYNQSYGLVGDEVNRNALIEDDQGKIWIGTELGASVYDSDEDIQLKIKPKLKLSNVKTQQGTQITTNSQSLNYSDNTIEFNFIGISYFDEKQITYRYTLNGFDTDWIYIDNPNSNSVRYTNLPPGKYEFVVEAGLSGVNWSDPVNSEFVIMAPFYTASWFIILMVILTVILLYSIYRIRFYFILKNQKKLQKEVKIRTIEIQEMNKEIQAQNEELRMQAEEIFTTNERLEETVQERTRQLREQNEKLSEYAFLNSHGLRAPICRLIGLLNLLTMTDKEEHADILILIHDTGSELDQITKNINSMLDHVDLTQLEETHSIEVKNAEKKDSSFEDLK